MTTLRLWVWLALAVFCSRSADATIKWSVNASREASLTAWQSYPPDNPGCTVPGVCGFYNTSIPANTLWYWCGWSTKERTEYWVNSATVNISVMLMRQKDLYNCALSNLTYIKGCYQMSDSVCETSTNCYNKIYGFSFVDPVCVLIANNEKKAANISVQVWQYYDSRRYYGTAFSILLLIICLGFSVGHVGYTCYHQALKPNHRLDELGAVNRDKLLASGAPRSNNHRDASEVEIAPASHSHQLERVSILAGPTAHSNSDIGGIDQQNKFARMSNDPVAGGGAGASCSNVGLIERMMSTVSGGDVARRSITTRV